MGNICCSKTPPQPSYSWEEKVTQAEFMHKLTSISSDTYLSTLPNEFCDSELVLWLDSLHIPQSLHKVLKKLRSKGPQASLLLSTFCIVVGTASEVHKAELLYHSFTTDQLDPSLVLYCLALVSTKMCWLAAPEEPDSAFKGFYKSLKAGRDPLIYRVSTQIHTESIEAFVKSFEEQAGLLKTSSCRKLLVKCALDGLIVEKFKPWVGEEQQESIQWEEADDTPCEVEKNSNQNSLEDKDPVSDENCESEDNASNVQSSLEESHESPKEEECYENWEAESSERDNEVEMPETLVEDPVVHWPEKFYPKPSRSFEGQTQCSSQASLLDSSFPKKLTCPDQEPLRWTNSIILRSPVVECSNCQTLFSSEGWHCLHCNYILCESCGSSQGFQPPKLCCPSNHLLLLTADISFHGGSLSCLKCSSSIVHQSWYCPECAVGICVSCADSLGYFTLSISLTCRQGHELVLEEHIESLYRSKFNGVPVCDLCGKVFFEDSLRCDICTFETCSRCYTRLCGTVVDHCGFKCGGNHYVHWTTQHFQCSGCKSSQPGTYLCFQCNEGFCQACAWLFLRRTKQTAECGHKLTVAQAQCNVCDQAGALECIPCSQVYCLKCLG